MRHLAFFIDNKGGIRQEVDDVQDLRLLGDIADGLNSSHGVSMCVGQRRAGAKHVSPLASIDIGNINFRTQNAALSRDMLVF